MKKLIYFSFIVSVSIIASATATAQMKLGSNPKAIHTDAVFEMETTNKGMLLPRVALSNTTSASPLTIHKEGMSVYNIATVDDVTPGYYYNNGTKWVKIAGVSSTDIDLRRVNTNSHITVDAGVGSNGTTAGGSGILAIGAGAGNANTANNNTFIGTQAGANNTVGIPNTFIGYQAGFSNTTGGINTAIGYEALYNNLIGNNNTALGTQAGLSNIASDNTFIGYQAGMSNTSGSNNIIIGTNAAASATTISNEVTIGNTSNNSYRMYAASWTNASDRRLKHNIKPLEAGLSFIMGLKPTEYIYNNSREKGKTLGFIAQDVEVLLKEQNMKGYRLVSHIDEQYLGLNTTELIPVLTKAIQEQQEQIEKLNARNAELLQQINKLNATVNKAEALASKVNALLEQLSNKEIKPQDKP